MPFKLQVCMGMGMAEILQILWEIHASGDVAGIPQRWKLGLRGFRGICFCGKPTGML